MPNANFNHPFPHPYSVQLELMSAIYKTLNGNYKIGIFESPTGTGKTLSLICSTMTWLRETKRRINDGTIKDKLEDNEEDDDEPEWVKKAYQDKIIDEYITKAKLFEEHLQQVKEKGTSIVIEERNSSKVKYFKKRKHNDTKDADDTDDLLPDDYDLNAARSNSYGMDTDVLALMNKLDFSASFKPKVQASIINESKIKIYFVSRTHSQLSQFSSQLRLTNFPSSINDESNESVKYLPLGSRKQLCINESVNSLNDLPAINDKCKELQQSETKCPFMPNYQQEEDCIRSEQLNDLVISDIHDIEDLNELGKNTKICPYYSTKADIPIAEIISMPYQLLLHKDTRNYLGLNLKDSIVIIDEAHNLIDTISRIYSSEITIKELILIRKGLKSYMKKFLIKMSVGNRVNLAKLMKLVTAIYKFMQREIDKNLIQPGSPVSREQIIEIDSSDLLNVYTLEDYFNKSKIAYKLETYMSKSTKTTEGEFYRPSFQSPLLFKIRSFFYSLSNPLKSGKFFFDKVSDNVSLKYLLLDPSEDFKDIVQESKCVLLAGGTMEPITDFTDFLVPQIKKDDILTFSCNHVIPDENLSVFGISKFLHTKFEFTYQYRDDPKLINALGNALLMLLETVPDGMVAFFPSYSYLDKVVKVWKQSTIYRQLNDLKPIFVESKLSSVDSVLSEYKKSIQIQQNGGLLLSVVNGKMSEGINFSDELARAVVMVGMPYPNAYSGELIAKKTFIEQQYQLKGHSNNAAAEKGREFYENLCMKAVNQSVGRAIRNINDYSVIFLFDSRYSTPKVKSRLSKWIQKRFLFENMDAESTVKASKTFFETKRHS